MFYDMYYFEVYDDDDGILLSGSRYAICKSLEFVLVKSLLVIFKWFDHTFILLQ